MATDTDGKGEGESEDFESRPTLPPRRIRMADPIVPPPPPPNRRPRQRSLTPYAVKKWARAHNVFQMIWQTLGIFGVIGASVFAYLQSFSTDAERKSAVRKIEMVDEKQAHEIDQLTKQVRQLERSHESLRKQTILLWRDRVSFRAAEREPVSRIRAQAAAFYREEYDRVIRRGKLEPDEAAREALHAVWHDRNRLLRRR